MIFVNRRRIKQNSGIVKDPSKYWYIEKYVYGVLKETVEVDLGTGTTFGSMDSGYSDDTFYGWSIDSTSTTRKFTATTTYKNTTTAVKNALDSENTLKIYAIYKYSKEELVEQTITATTTESTITATVDGTVKIGGWHEIDKTDIMGSSHTYTYESITLSSSNTNYYVKISGSKITGTVFTHNASTYITKNVTKGTSIVIKGYGYVPSAVQIDTYYITCTIDQLQTTTKYRVDDHPPVFAPIN